MPAYQLVNPARGHLATPAGRKLKSALGAAARGKITGAHWLELLTAPRAAFGGPVSARAEQAYKALEQMVADFLRPALGAVAAAEFAAGVELAQSAPADAAAVPETGTAPATATDPTPAPAAAATAVEPDAPSGAMGTAPAAPGVDTAPFAAAPLRPVPASDVDASHRAAPAAATPFPSSLVDATSAGSGAAGPGSDSETDAAPVPAPGVGPAAAAVEPDTTPVRSGPAAGTPAPAPVGDLAELLHQAAVHPGTILAVTSTHTATAQTALAQVQDLEPSDLPTVQVHGHDRASLIHALYARLGLGQRRRLPGLDEAEALIAAELMRVPRLVVVTTTLGLRPSALLLLHRLWSPKPFALVLVGDTTLDGLLKRHDLADLHPHVIVHRVQQPAPAAASAPAPAAGPAAPASGTAAPDGDLIADLREAAEHRSVLVVTSPDPAATGTALADALDTGALQPLYVHGTALDQVVPELFQQLGLGRRRPRTLETAVVKITAELRRSPRPVVVPAAHELPEDALRWLGLLWASSAFPLVLGGDLRLDDVLGRPELTGLYASATRRLTAAPPGPAPAPDGDTSPAARAAAGPGPEPAATPSATATATATATVPAAPLRPAPAPGGDTAEAAEPEPAAAGPDTASLLHDLRSTVEHRTLLCITGPADTATTAITAATRHLPLPAVRIHPRGTDEAALIHALYTALGLDHRQPQPREHSAALKLLAAALDRAARLVVVPDAHQLATAALQTLYGLWARGGTERFPLVLAGDDHLHTVLNRPKLASLKSAANHHRLPPTEAPAPEARESAPAPDPLPAAAPAANLAPETRETPTPTAPAAAPDDDRAAPRPAPAAGRATAEPAPAADPFRKPTTMPTPTPAPQAAAAPAPPTAAGTATTGSAPAPAAGTATVPETAPLRPAPAGEAPAAPTPAVALVLAPSPTTLHHARSTLPQLIRAAGQGTSTPLTRGTHHALLTAPTTATALGWDLTTATAHGTADARKKLGDLIQAAATGHPQVLRRHVTPLAVLLPATPDGTPLPPATHPDHPTPGTPDTAATTAHSTAVVTPTPDAALGAPGDQPAPAPAPAAVEPGTGTLPAAAAPLAPTAPASSTTPPPDNPHTPANTTRRASTTQPSSRVDAPGDTLFPTPADTATAGPAALLPLVDPADVLPLADPDALLPLAAGQPTPGPAEFAATDTPAAAAPGQDVDAGTATSSPPAPAAGEPALQNPAPATAPPAGQPATVVPAAPRPPRRLAPLADALTTVLTPQAQAPDTDTPAGPRALSTGIRTLDDALGGLQPGRFYLVAAPPGAGGSLLAIAAARTTALDHHLPVLYAASGLTRADVAARIVAAHLPVDYRRLRTGRLTPTEQADATTLHAELAAARLYIDDGTDLTPEAIAETAADLAHPTDGQPGLALVVVDRLQALDDPRLPLSGPRLTDAAQALAHLARTHHVPVLAILDTDHPDLITTLGLDTTLTLHPHPDAPTTQLLATIAERDLGTQATLTLTADRTHARLTDPTPFNPYATTPTPAPEAPPAPAPAPEAPTQPTTAAPEAPTQASAWPTVATPGHPTQNAAAAPQPDPDPEVTPATAAALDTLANLTPDQPPARPLRPTRGSAPRTAGPRPARTSGGDYAGRDYGHFLNMISSVVDQTLQEHGGDIKAAITALELKAIPNGMALFEATRVGGNYEHTVYPERLEFLSKKSRDGADDIWEGRHKWENGPLLEQLKAGTHPDVDVDVLDTNAAYCSALKVWLPIGALQHDPNGGFNPKRSGIYLLPKRPTWEHPHLPDPIGNRREPGPVLLDDATIRLLIRCHKLDLCEAPYITQAWTSGASENIAEKFRRVLTIAREKAILEGDDATEKYVKAIYSKFVSTIGESSFNRDLRRPDWMHIIRSQAFANLWYKALRAHEHGLTIVRLRGTDELHITGDTAWRTVFEEGRLTTQLKLKSQYTLYAKAA
ncbi:DnaB-like helicase C-terminal domain-containing protein [Kitasatospora sp. NPDC006697]|uniref:DnaB-like helicase C-terminal domain-containing protein n=1 Tax=Kitasatospora sp. NPDC006697 TaxID=3364020 RepID=UPI0036BC729A